MLNVFAAARIGETTEDGYVQVEVDPADMYPATIAHIRSRIASSSVPDGALKQEYDAAKLVPESAWDMALVPDAGNPDRAAALEIARRWFTEVLHQAVGAPMRLRITRDLTYKL